MQNPPPAAAANAPPLRPRWPTRLLVLTAVLGFAAYGGHRLAFLCDDAFIIFRHVDQAMAGNGLVWNAPPFQPVEGSTGLLWSLLLWLIWAGLGVEPPAAAIPLGIGIGLVTLTVVASALWRLCDRRDRPLDEVTAALALFIVAGNRTFLCWMTSGLETPLVVLCATAWVVWAFRTPNARGLGWWLGWSTLAALAALTRPDCLLLVAATAASAVVATPTRASRKTATLLGLLPLLLVAGQVVWRRTFFGEWLPNTYYAKVTTPWPSAGWRYLYCFVVEHGTWLLLPLLLLWLPVGWRRGALGCRGLVVHTPAFAAVAVLLAHAGFYVLQVGGDHFEFRVLSHLVPLTSLAMAALATALLRPAIWRNALFVLLGIASSVGFLHRWLTTPLPPPYYAPLSPQLPAWLAPLLRDYDRHHMWLNFHLNCQRCEVHANNLAATMRSVGPRSRLAVDGEDVLICQATAVGYVGWALPDAAILDRLGLCDYVIARSPLPTGVRGFLPAAVVRTILAGADGDGSGGISAEELTNAIVGVSGFDLAATAKLAGALVFLFGARDQIEPGAHEDVVRFFAEIRFLAHEREPPAGYIEAFDPNVTIEDQHPVVRRRSPPLGPDRVRAIEAEWRAKVTTPPTGR